MKLKYKQRLLLWFGVIFLLFTVGIATFEQSRAKLYKTEALEEKLDAYADIINNVFSQEESLDSLLKYLPSNIRVTLIEQQGKVFYDNAFDDLSKLENHAQRPEVLSAKEKTKGSFIRKSATNGQEYLYYAKSYGNHYVRVALPYNIEVKHFLRADNGFMYFTIILFLIAMLFINYAAGMFGKSIQRLRDFTLTSQDSSIGQINISFPDDELGEIGQRIVQGYKELEISKKQITQEREKLLQHVHSSEEGVCFFNSDSKVEFYNGLFIQYLNNIVDGASSEACAIFSDSSFEKLNTFLQSDHNEKYFEMRIDKQGKMFSVQINVFDDKSFEVIINDTTKQEKTRLLKQEMTGNIAHELRTPVTSIRGYLETVLEQPLDEQKQRHFLTQAFNQTIVLSELIRDMSLITKIEESPQSFSLESVNIANLLKELRNDLTQPLQKKEIEMDWSVEENVVINGNRNLIYSIFRNLTDNVISYAGVGVRIHISKYNEDSKFYYFSYSDSGIGIPNEQHLNRLFERFYRINDGRTRDTGGSGLGLSIVKNAILFHHGTITVKNRQQGGLEFLFKLRK